MEGRVKARPGSAPAACFSVEAWIGHVKSWDTPSVDLTTVDDQRVSRDVAGVVAREVHDSASDVVRLPGNP